MLRKDEAYFIETDNSLMKQNGVDAFIQYSKGKNVLTAAGHVHTSIEFLYMLSGSYQCTLDEQEFCVSAGELIMFPSSSIHRVRSKTDGNNDYLVIKIKPEVFVGLSGENENSAYAMRFMLHTEAKLVWHADELKGSELGRAIDTILREVKCDLSAHNIALKLAIASLLVAVLRDDERRSASAAYIDNLPIAMQIYKAITHINQNYDKDLTARDCATLVNMSYSYFSRSFKEVTKKSFKQYLTELRINHAEKALTLTDKSVTEICFACGFNDVSYFIAQYKALRGKTPLHFRKEGKL